MITLTWWQFQLWLMGFYLFVRYIINPLAEKAYPRIKLAIWRWQLKRIANKYPPVE